MRNNRSRRNVLAAALSLAGVMSLGAACKPRHSEAVILEFDALGAQGFVKLDGQIRHLAKLRHIKKQIERRIAELESVFSLYDDASEISRLNREGYLEAASNHMISVLKSARHISEATGGVFDVTVQAFWTAAQRAVKLDDEAQAMQLWEEAAGRVNYQNIQIDGGRVSFAAPNMAITLNGIAQGYISEYIKQDLTKLGLSSALVNIGEYSGFGPRPWSVAIQDPNNIFDVVQVVELSNMSMATSSAKGGYLGEGRSHIFSAQSFNRPPRFSSATVIYKDGALADGFATAFTLLELERVEAIVKRHAGMSAILVRESGEVIKVTEAKALKR